MTEVSETYLFVGQHQYHSVTQLIFLQHFEELILGLTNALSVVAVHNKDDTCNKNNIYQTGAMNEKSCHFSLQKQQLGGKRV